MYKYAFRCKFQTLIKHYYTCEKNGFLIFYVLKQAGGALYVNAYMSHSVPIYLKDINPASLRYNIFYSKVPTKYRQQQKVSKVYFYQLPDRKKLPIMTEKKLQHLFFVRVLPVIENKFLYT